MGKDYVIVGGLEGGLSAAYRLRQLDEDALITVFEKKAYVSFACSGMSLFISEIIKSKDMLTPETPKSIKKYFNIDVKTSTEVVNISRYENYVAVRDLTTGILSNHKYDKLILATGSNLIIPEIKGIESAGVFAIKSMDDMLAISEHIKKSHARRAAVIGGGTVGLEAAENLSRRGIKTCIVEISDHSFPSFDYDMARFASYALENNGVALFTENTVNNIYQSEEGLRLELSDGRFVLVDMVLLSTGLQPEIRLAKDAGLDLGVTGGILVDERQQSSDQEIYAVGDAAEVNNILGGKMLIPSVTSANKQGRIAADNICGLKTSYKHTLGVSIIKLFDMQLACAGLTEKQLADRNIKYEKVFTQTTAHERYLPNANSITIKTLFDKKSGRIYGVQMAGKTGVDKRIDIFATAMRAGFSVKNLCETELGYAPLFGLKKDAIIEAGYMASDVFNGLSDVVHWNDVRLIKDVAWLDVRTSDERRVASIPESLHIPFEELRSRARELPIDKTIVVFSQFGQRGYLAERILKQLGYAAKNLSGGFGLYQFFISK